MKRAVFLVVVSFVLAGLIGALAWFQFVQKPKMIEGFIRSAPQPVETVAVARAQALGWTPEVRAIGTLRATSQVDIAAQVGGIVSAIKFDTAQDVAKGAPLVEIDSAIEQADLKAQVAALRNAQASFERQTQLQSSAAASRAALDQAVAARDQAGAAVERIRAQIAQKQIAAPFAGRLGIRRIDVGQYIAPGVTLVTLQQLDPLFVDFQIPEGRISGFAEGQKIEVRIDGFGGQVFEGRIRFIDARVNADTRQFLVRGEIANPDKKLRPGMFANVRVEIGAARQIVATARTAVDYSLYGDSVYVARPEAAESQFARIERRLVKVGQARGFLIAIDEGLRPDEIVVTAGQIKLAPDMRVKMDFNAALPPLDPLPSE